MMMRRRRNLLSLVRFFGLISVIATNAAAAATSTSRQKAIVSRLTPPAILKNKSLEIPRGGALVEKTNVAKAASAVSLLQGAVAWLNPTSALEGYGLESSPIALLIMRRLGMLLIQMGVLGVFLFFRNSTCSVQTALGAASLGFLVELARGLIQNDRKTLGSGIGPQLVLLLGSIIVSYTNLSNQKYADTVNKVNAVWALVNGVLFALFPAQVLNKGWGVGNDLDLKTIGMVSGLGWWCVAYSIFLAGLAWDMEAVKSLTWSRLMILLIHVIPSRGESIGMNESKKMVLFAYQAIILVGLFVQDGISCLIRCSV